MLQEAAYIGLGIRLTNNPFKADLTNMINSSGSYAKNLFSNFGDSAGKTMGASLAKSFVAAMGTMKLAEFTKECLDLGSNLSEVQNVVDVTFKEMAGQINDFAQNAMSQFGLSETVAKKYTGTLGSMAKSFGFTNKEAVSMSESITGLTADVASFYNLSTDKSYDKLKSIFTGETESLKELGVVMTQTALDQYALNNGFGKTTAKMTEQEKVMLRYQFVMSRLSDASGDFARTSDGWANQTRVLSLRIDSLKATLGQSFINVLTPVIKELNEFVGKVSDAADVVLQFTNVMSGNVSTSTGSIKESAGQAADAVTGIGTAADDTMKKLNNLAGYDELNVIGASSSGSSETENTGSGSNLGNIMESTNNVKLDPDNNIVNKYLESIKKSWKDADFSDFGDTLAYKLDDQLVKIDWKTIQGGANKASKSLATFLNGIFGNEKLFEDTGTAIAEAFNTKWGVENAFISNFKFDAFGTSLGKGLNKYLGKLDWKTKLDSSLKWGEGVAKSLNSFLKETDFKLVGGTVGKFLLSNINKAYGFVTNADYDQLGEDIADSINGFFESMDENDGWYKVGKTFSSLTSGMIKAFTKAIMNIKWKDVLKGLEDSWWSMDLSAHAIVLTGLTLKLGAGATIKELLLKALGLNSGGTGAEAARTAGNKLGIYLGAGLTAAIAGWDVGKWIGEKIFGNEYGEYDMTPMEMIDYLMDPLGKKLTADNTPTPLNSNSGIEYLQNLLGFNKTQMQRLWNTGDEWGFSFLTDEELKSLRLDSDGNLYSDNVINDGNMEYLNDIYQQFKSSKINMSVTVTPTKMFNDVKEDLKKMWGLNGKTTNLKVTNTALGDFNIAYGKMSVLKNMDGKLIKLKTNATSSSGLTLAVNSFKYIMGLNGRTSKITADGKKGSIFSTIVSDFKTLMKNNKKSVLITANGTKKNGFKSVFNDFKSINNKTVNVTAKGTKSGNYTSLYKDIMNLKDRTIKINAQAGTVDKESFKSLFAGVANIAKAFFETGEGKKFSSSVKGLISSLFVPAHATGAYVAANTPQLAIIGDNTREGEFVAPESKLKAAVREAVNENGGSSAEQISLLREQNELLRRLLEKDSGITEDQVYKAVRRKDKEYTLINGHSAFT